MRTIIAQKQDFVQFNKSIDEALVWAKSAQQPYKEELLNDLKRAGDYKCEGYRSGYVGVASNESAVVEVGFYQNGDFVDLCRGPHVAKHF